MTTKKTKAAATIFRPNSSANDILLSSTQFRSHHVILQLLPLLSTLLRLPRLLPTFLLPRPTSLARTFARPASDPLLDWNI
jgi:hypothetical protein